MGLAFKAVLYKTEDLCDCVWNGRPEWARPAVGGIALGLLAIRRCTGSATPYMYKTAAGGYVLWFLILLAFAKIAAPRQIGAYGGRSPQVAPCFYGSFDSSARSRRCSA